MELSILLLPLIASIISGFFGKYIGDRNSEIFTSLLVSISAILSIIIFYNVLILDYENNIILAKWIDIGSFNVNWSIKIDALSSVMLVVVNLISALVHIYSIGYMATDPHKPRFMAYLSLFTFCYAIIFLGRGHDGAKQMNESYHFSSFPQQKMRLCSCFSF